MILFGNNFLILFKLFIIIFVLAAMGLIMYCGIPFIGINMAAPFLMLGIGIDDTFVMLGAWRRTSIHAPVEERMSEAFRDAAVSITITSVTDMLSFFVGVITPFPCVRIFCIYTGKMSGFFSLYNIFKISEKLSIELINEGE